MAKIYISSTSSDLEEFREAAYAQLRKSRHDTIAMQDYNPTSEPPIRKCLQDVREADIYVGLIGLCYGSIPDTDNPDRLSYTELEYREALAHGKQVLTFLTDPANWPAGKTDAYTGDNEKGARIDAFRKSIGKNHIRGSFWTEDNLAKALSPAVEEALRKLKPTNTVEQLDNLDGLSTEDLQNLAGRFGIVDPYDTAGPELRRLLTMKADEYRALRKEVEAIDDGLKRLSNLKAAAQDAIARVDLDEVEELLSRVQEVELEEAAKTAELRAQNALLRGNVDQAYRLLRSSANSFEGVNEDERITRTLYRTLGILRGHALRFGGDGFRYALQLVKEIQPELREHSNMKWRADILIWKAIVSKDQGTRTDGPEGARLLAEAVTAYRKALEVRTRADHPVDWAMTQNNLGTALQDQGSRTDGPEGARLLADAVTAYRKALEVYTRADHPVNWAITQENIAIALKDRALRPDAADTAGDLAAALEAVDGALEVFDPVHLSYRHSEATRLREAILEAMAALAVK